MEEEGINLNFMEEERVDVEVVVKGEQSHEVSYDEVRHDQKAQKLWQHSFRKQDLCEISETHEKKAPYGKKEVWFLTRVSKIIFAQLTSSPAMMA